MSPRRIDAYARAASAAAERVQATRRSIVGGERTNLDALDAERQRLETLRDLARARYDYLLGGLSLGWKAGTLADADIARVRACCQTVRSQSHTHKSDKPREGDVARKQ